MDNIEVSVLSLAFNQERYIREALEGMVKQKTDFKYEIIIHDDCSKDRTPEIIKEYAAKYPDKVFPILQKENQYSQGIDMFYTYMLPKARGRFVCFCEGDDFWTDCNKLQLQYDAMKAHPECSMICHTVQGISEDETKPIQTFPAKPAKEGIMTAEEAIHRAFHDQEWVFHTTSYFMKKHIFTDAYIREIDFFLNPMYGDQAVFQLAAATGDFYYIDKVMSCYRMGSVGSMVKRDKNPEFRKIRSQRAIHALKSFDSFTNGRFREDVEYCIKRNEYVLFETQKEYKKMLDKEYRDYYEMLPKSARLHVHVSSVIPAFDFIYYGLRKWRKGY